MATTIKSDIITAIDAANPTIADPELYMGTAKIIPFFFDASELVPDSGDVLVFTKALPPKTRAIAIALCHDGSNGLAASTTIAITAGTTALTTTATYATSVDGNGACNVLSLKNTDVSGAVIKGTVGGADWQNTVDLYGWILLSTAQ